MNDLESEQDRHSQRTTMADQKLISVYGDTVNQNDGHQLHGGKVEDALLAGSTHTHYTIHQMDILVNCLFPLLLLNGEE